MDERRRSFEAQALPRLDAALPDGSPVDADESHSLKSIRSSLLPTLNLSYPRSVQGGDEGLEADPSPINPVMGDQAISDIHDFDQIHLVTLRRLARIFPGQLPSVGEEQPGAIPAAEFVSEFAKSRLKKRPDLAPSPQNPFFPIRERHQDRRRFENGVLCI